VSDDIRQQMARMAAVAAWGLGKALLIKGGKSGRGSDFFYCCHSCR